MKPKFEDFDMVLYLQQLAEDLGYIPSMEEARARMAEHIANTYPEKELPPMFRRMQ